MADAAGAGSGRLLLLRLAREPGGPGHPQRRRDRPRGAEPQGRRPGALASERMGAEAGLRVTVLEPGHTLVLHQPADPDTGRPLDRDDPNLGRYYGWSWVFVLDEVDPHTTRLIVRSRVDGRPRYLIKAFYALLLEFPHFVMEQGMLNGIKQRAERARMSR